eukprot:UN20778
MKLYLDFTNTNAFFCELFMSFLLVFTYFQTYSDKKIRHTRSCWIISTLYFSYSHRNGVYIGSLYTNSCHQMFVEPHFVLLRRQ